MRLQTSEKFNVIDRASNTLLPSVTPFSFTTQWKFHLVHILSSYLTCSIIHKIILIFFELPYPVVSSSHLITIEKIFLSTYYNYKESYFLWLDRRFNCFHFVLFLFCFVTVEWWEKLLISLSVCQIHLSDPRYFLSKKKIQKRK